MKFGFNSKVQVGPDVYDVQTEERGASHPFIDTLVLMQGRVVYRHRTSYEDLAASGAMDQAILRARVEKQHRDILEALRAGVLSLEKAAPSQGAGIAVKLLNAGSWLHSGHVTLDIEVSSKGGGKPVTGAKVEVFVEGGEGAPESYFAHTDAAGRTSLHFPFPTLVEPSMGALVIRAQVAEALGELRYQLKPKPNR
ncbi:MAG: hypothetical protein DMG31_15845 [Acidobacteria bacterium]|nr:MAG: hypothetical protein DMG31_15845 [Acidobacteriota bacterium]